MYARTTMRPKQRKAQPKMFPAPIGGWISNRALATPQAGMAPGAAILENFFPRASSVVLRRGSRRYATLGDGTKDATALFSYNTGAVRKLFGATGEAIYEVTSIEFAYNAELSDDEDNIFTTEDGDIFGWSSTGDGLMTGYTGGNWCVVQFATTGGVYLIGVNGADTGFIYDGTAFWPNLPGGLWRIPYDGEVTPFTEGSTVTGSTSGAEATIFRVEDEYLIVQDVSFTPQTWTIPYAGGSAAFLVGSTLRGSTSSAAAKITAIAPGTTTWTLPYDTGTGAFAGGEEVTGGTSGAVATVVSVAGDTAAGTLTVETLTGTFQDNETLTGDVVGAAKANGTASAPILAGTASLEGLIGSFILGEPLRDGSGGAATAGAAETFVGGGSFEDGETLTDDEGGEATVVGDYYSEVPGVTFPDGVTIANMAFVWTYKNRLWFAQKDSLNTWYLEGVDAIGGDALLFPLAGVLGKGGSVLFGQGWSLENGEAGGLSEQCAFVSSEGEVAIYQGADPSTAATFSKVGVYRIGKPLGNRAFIKGGGDLAICTSVGLVPLSKAIQLDVTSLNIATLSNNIADAWSDATELRSMENWQAELWPEQKMALVAPPTTADAPAPVLFVSNTETGAWAPFTGWSVKCMEVFGGRLFFGGSEGRVVIANVGGDDEGQPYTGVVMPLYEDMGSPSSNKVPTTGCAVVRGTTTIPGQVTFQSDFSMTVPSAPDAVSIGTIANIWGSAVWGQSVWGGGLSDVVSQGWVSLGGRGRTCSLAYQVTSGAAQPLDAELVRLEMLYTTAEVMG